MVPEKIYREKRIGILEGFLIRPKIFLTPHFYERHEELVLKRRKIF